MPIAYSSKIQKSIFYFENHAPTIFRNPINFPFYDHIHNIFITWGKYLKYIF